MSEIYGDRIIELYRNPLNEGELEDAEVFSAENPKCGDKTKIYLEIEDEEISDVKHETKGCAICKAYVSLFSEEIKGRTIKYARDLESEDVLNLLDAEIPERRVKCATLSLRAIEDL